MEQSCDIGQDDLEEQYHLLYMHWLGNPSSPELLNPEQNTSPARFFVQVLKITPC